MGANTFVNSVRDFDNLDDAFQQLREMSRGEALEDGLDDGYTGTIAEKTSYRFVRSGTFSTDQAWEIIDKYLSENVDKFDDEAMAIKLDNGDILFFGWASS